MTKVELIAAVANDANLTKKDAEAAVNSALNAITAALKDGDKVTLVGFGTFEVRERPERKGRNPQTGAEITIEASKLPAFKAGKALKDKVAKGFVDGISLEDVAGASADTQASQGSSQAIAALVSLGYSQSEAALAVSKIDAALPVEEIIKLALRSMAGRR